ncbi:purine nucleoside permease [Granulicella sp. dw_53]|uniref:purine-nucleoside phosphorylase n=1 Tax=Granulicella sp. dw_53 TaxID=2719792 RepID=UPI001BD586F2|nr:purine nucleoside permease [Granulicella sp. dw_53]
MGKLLKCFVVMFVGALGCLSGGAQGAAGPLKIKVVVVTTFEQGEDTGDAPGEFQYWVEREKLTEKLDFPGGVRALRMNAAHDVLGIVTGMTLANAGPSIMALGLDPRFDLSHAYWLVDGIAGVDPADGTIGTAAWASYVVNDVSRQVDSTEKPAGWPYGLFVIGAKGPNEIPAKPMTDNSYPLNAGLAGWAYGLTKDLKLPDNAAMKADREQWVGFPNAMKAPVVIRGDSFTADTYWHGKVMTQYANDWVTLWTKGKGNFTMSNMEDSGIAEALKRLQRMHRVDYQRLMVVRVGSNYSMQAPGMTAVESVTAPYVQSTAFETEWVVGNVVVRELVTHWDRYEGSVPGR